MFKILPISILVFASLAIASTDNGNTENVDFLRSYVLAPETVGNVELKQVGKASNGSVCNLNVKNTKFGLNILLSTEDKQSVYFRASVSSKVSTAFEVNDSYDGHIEASQIEFTMDERSSTVNQQSIVMDTANDPGTDKNIVGITITNQNADDETAKVWTFGKKIKRSLYCKF